MANVIIRPSWHLPETEVTPERDYLNRRSFFKQMGMAAGAGLAGAALAAPTPAQNLKLYPGKQNPLYSPRLKLTPEKWAVGYNNFYEFTTNKEGVRFLTGKFVTHPWKVSISGLCKKPFKIDAQQLISDMGVEQRVYRFRCVEAWSMVVPWNGFPLNKIIAKAEPTAKAKYVRFVTAFNPQQMPGIKFLPNYPWPYTEGMRLDEAMHDLTFVASGIYGKPLPKQNGAPLRLVVPWKYGFKSIKSIVKIEFVDKQPKTLWNALSPREYPFESNVEPDVPHPRWSQATERVLGTGLRIKSLKFNGYNEVAKFYKR